jgi:hypothetical protein
LSQPQAPRASLTNVVALNGGPGSLEAQTDVLHPSPATLSSPLGLAALLLVVLENVRLLLESALALDSQFGGHDCCVLGNRSKLATMVYFSEVVVEVAVRRSACVQPTVVEFSIVDVPSDFLERECPASAKFKVGLPKEDATSEG